MCQSAMAAAFLATETGLPIVFCGAQQQRRAPRAQDGEPELLEGLPLWILENQQQHVGSNGKREALKVAKRKPGLVGLVPGKRPQRRKAEAGLTA